MSGVSHIIIRSCLQESPYGDKNKIVFSSPEAMVEFSGEKLKPRRSSKPLEHMQLYIRLKGQLFGHPELRFGIAHWDRVEAQDYCRN